MGAEHSRVPVLFWVLLLWTPLHLIIFTSVVGTRIIGTVHRDAVPWWASFVDLGAFSYVYIAAFLWLRWTRLLPRFPAVLLVPAALAAWAALCYIYLGGWEEPAFPLPFWGGRHHGSYIRVDNILTDLFLALATAYTFAMVVDRLVFPAIRAGRRRKRGREETG